VTVLHENSDKILNIFVIFCFNDKFWEMVLVVTIYSKATNRIIQNMDQIRRRPVTTAAYFEVSLPALREYGANPNILNKE
jgi:hypothetical protein